MNEFELNNLRTIARNAGGDWTLNRIAFLAAHGLSIRLTLLVDGCILAGDTTKPEAFVGRIDTVLAKMLDESEAASVEEPPSDPANLAAFTGMTQGDFAQIREMWQRGVLMGPELREIREQDQRLTKEVSEHELAGTSREDLPEEVRRWLDERHLHMPTLTLANATWTPPASGGAVTLPGPIRVITSKVAAWWPASAEPSGSHGA